MPPTPAPVACACDACRRRKSKCDGRQPCLACVSARLDCTFLEPPRRAAATTATATTATTRAGAVDVPPAGAADAQAGADGATAAATAAVTITLDACIAAYLDRIYPIVPLVDPHTLRAQAARTSASLLARQFIAAFCAYVATFGNVLPSLTLTGLGQQLLSAALHVQTSDRVTHPSTLPIYISFFLYGAHAGLGNYLQGWFYLREATTLYMMQERGVDSLVPTTDQRMFWILLVSERAHAIRRNRPITLQITPLTPALGSSDPIDLNLRYLASLFRPFDAPFFSVWNGASTSCNKQYLLDLEAEVRTALPVTLNVSSEQVANLRVSQLWLQIRLWELFPKFGFLSSESVHECLTFQYPVLVARDLCRLVDELPIGSLQIHGVGLTEKIFDVACALTDILPFLATRPTRAESNAFNHLTQTASLLAKLPNGSSKFVPLLLVKINELVPNFVETICQATEVPVTSIHELHNPITGFSYEEELGRALYADLCSCGK